MNMRTKITVTIIFSLFFTACGYFEGGLGGMHNVFADLENGIRKTDEDLFKKHWTQEGYDKNMVGGSGMTGSSVFNQGSRKKWFLKPKDINNPIKQGKIEIYPCEVYAWEKSKAVDEIFLAVASENQKVLGGGEKLEEVKHLAERFNKGEPLELK